MNPGFSVRSFRGIVLSLPAAFMVAFDIGAFLVAQDWESEWLIALNGFLVAWTVVGIWIAESATRRRALSRAARALSIAGFMLPASLVVGLVHTPDPQNTTLPINVFVFLYCMIGVNVGGIAWVIARSFARMDREDQAQGQ